jgi:CubicO group peptidase (beta-lactamase class C family)
MNLPKILTTAAVFGLMTSTAFAQATDDCDPNANNYDECLAAAAAGTAGTGAAVAGAGATTGAVTGTTAVVGGLTAGTAIAGAAVLSVLALSLLDDSTTSSTTTTD